MAVTIKDVAAKCGRSISTVSKAFNNYADISAETREAVQRAAREIGYRWYYADGSLYQQRVYTRDGDGNILKEEYFDGAGDLTHVYEYE